MVCPGWPVSGGVEVPPELSVEFPGGEFCPEGGACPGVELGPDDGLEPESENVEKLVPPRLLPPGPEFARLEAETPSWGKVCACNWGLSMSAIC